MKPDGFALSRSAASDLILIGKPPLTTRCSDQTALPRKNAKDFSEAWLAFKCSTPGETSTPKPPPSKLTIEWVKLVYAEIPPISDEYSVARSSLDVNSVHPEKGEFLHPF